MNWKKPSSVILFSAVLFTFFTVPTFGQERPRVFADEQISQPTNIETSSVSKISKNIISRPVLTNQIVVVGANKPSAPLVKKTASSSPVNPVPGIFSGNPMAAVFNQRLRQAMDEKLGIRYVYGSTGPYTFDCSGLVWSVFNDAGLNFERTSARNYWQEFEPVSGEERYKFGTLVFFNGLGHVGIVVSDKGFYHASSSKGVTYSSFDGYWGKRIVGFRRIPSLMNAF